MMMPQGELSGVLCAIMSGFESFQMLSMDRTSFSFMTALFSSILFSSPHSSSTPASSIISPISLFNAIHLHEQVSHLTVSEIY